MAVQVAVVKVALGALLQLAFLAPASGRAPRRAAAAAADNRDVPAVEAIEREYQRLREATAADPPHLRAGGDAASRTPDDRFPQVGSADEFDRVCHGSQLRDHADFLRRAADGKAPLPRKVFHVKGARPSEGVADFMAQCQLGLAMAMQHGHGLYIEWKDVRLLDVLAPAPGGGFNWSDPRLLRACEGDPACEVVDVAPLQVNHWQLQNQAAVERQRLQMQGDIAAGLFTAALPLRKGYTSYTWPVLTSPMPPQVAAACTLGALFAPSPRVVEAAPEGFRELLGLMHDPRTLAISVYVRTYASEQDTQQLTNAELDALRLAPRSQWTLTARHGYAVTARCALQLEERYASQFDRVVWFVASDAADLKRALVEEFDESGTGGRRVLATGARGRHSAPVYWQGKKVGAAMMAEKGAHYNQAVREAIADWWLLGEGDLAVIGSYNSSAFESYPNTAFMRTARARSVYRVKACDSSGGFDDDPRPDSCTLPPDPERCDLEGDYLPIWGRGAADARADAAR